jgi:hypothetical protein
VLKWADRILGSILAAVPIPAAEILKEGREAIEGAVEDADPPEDPDEQRPAAGS